MELYKCRVCGHIELDGSPGNCLVCRAGWQEFEEVPDAVETPGNSEDLTEMEKKHVPQIVVVKECGLIPDQGCTDVHVRVGEIQHVMEEEHYITHIDFYLNHSFISRVWLSPGACNPAAALHLNATSGKLTAIEHCNKHGDWLAEVDL